MPITALPTPPQRTQPADVFSTNADLFVAALPQFGVEANALQTDVNAKQVAANNSAINAATSEANASQSALVAQTASNAAKWVSGTNYTQGTVVYSPSNFKSYRCKVAGVSTVDPANDITKWTAPGLVPGFGGAVVPSGNVTLTATSAGAQSITPAAAGYYVTLPDATTMPNGAVQFLLTNASADYDLGIKDASGNKLGWIRPNTTALVGLANSSFPEGVWSLFNVEKTGISAQMRTMTIYAGAAVVKCQAVDANRTFVVWGNLVNEFYYVVHDASTNTFSATTDFGNFPNGITLLPGVTANQVMLIGLNGTTLKATMLDIGASGTTAAQAGTATRTLSSAAVGVLALNAIQANTSGNFVISYCKDSTNIVPCVVGLSTTSAGTVLTFGTEQILPASAGASGNASGVIGLYSISNTTVLTISYNSTTLYALPYSVTGNSLATGTQATTTAAVGNGWPKFLPPLATGRIPVIVPISTGAQLALVSLAGTVATMNTALLFHGVVGANLIEAAAVASNKILLVGPYQTTTSVHLATDTAGTISLPAEATYTFGGNAAVGPIISATSSSAKFVCAAGNGINVVATIDVSGTSPNLTATTLLAQSRTSLLSPSDSFGNRDVRLLSTPTVTYMVATDAPALLGITPDGYLLGKPVSLSSTLAAWHSRPNDAWFVGAYALQKVEAA